MTMDGVDPDSAAFFEATVFLRYFNDLPDPRQRGKVLYRLDEVLLLSLLAVLAGAQTFVDVARFGSLSFCAGSGRSAMERHHTITSATTMPTLDPEQFQRCFVSWIASLLGREESADSFRAFCSNSSPKTFTGGRAQLDPNGHHIGRCEMILRVIRKILGRAYPRQAWQEGIVLFRPICMRKKNNTPVDMGRAWAS
jgi:DDE_Tnp_1-associated